MPPAGIRIHDRGRLAAEDLRLRPRGHWDQPNSSLNPNIPLSTLAQIPLITPLKYSFL
jgi:hypothetical protein